MSIRLTKVTNSALIIPTTYVLVSAVYVYAVIGFDLSANPQEHQVNISTMSKAVLRGVEIAVSKLLYLLIYCSISFLLASVLSFVNFKNEGTQRGVLYFFIMSSVSLFIVLSMLTS